MGSMKLEEASQGEWVTALCIDVKCGLSKVMCVAVDAVMVSSMLHHTTIVKYSI